MNYHTHIVRYISNKYKKQESGFTLIELLIVVIVLGVLSAMALPNYIGQVGKSREIEAKMNLGAIGRAQQTYHFEHQVFASNLGQLSSGNMFDAEYYDYPNADIATGSLLKQRAIPLNSADDRVRDYAVGVYFGAGAYNLAICEGREVGQIVQVPDVLTGICTNGGTRLK